MSRSVRTPVLLAIMKVYPTRVAAATTSPTAVVFGQTATRKSPGALGPAGSMPWTSLHEPQRSRPRRPRDDDKQQRSRSRRPRNEDQVDVIVDDDARGKGVGRLLNEAAIEHALDQGAITVDLTSRPSREAANRLYQRIGFVPRETNVYRYSKPVQLDG